MSWRGQGRRARGRRGDQDANLDNTAWLEELEKAATEQDDEEGEEEWASKLRRRRSQEPEPPAPRAPDPPGRAPELPRAPVAHDLSPYPPLGSEPPAPPPPPSRPAPGPAREPDYRLLGMEPDTRRPGGDRDPDWDTGSSGRAAGAADWTTRDPSPPAPSAAGDWSTRDPSPPAPSAAGDWSTRDPSPPAPADWSTRDPSPPAPADWTTRDPSPPAPADWTTRDPAPSAAADPGTDWPTWEPEGSGGPQGGAPVDRPEGSGEPQGGAPVDRPEGSGEPQGGAPVDRDGSGLGEPEWRPAGPDATAGLWSPAEPVDREPDYPALFGELNRRNAAQREALWDSAPAPEPYEEPVSPDPPAPTWPFEETTGTWEPSDRSFIWPAEELPAVASEWEPSTPSWLDEPTAQPPTWQPAPGDAALGVGVEPDDWAAGIQSGVPPTARAPGEPAGDVVARRWWPDEAVEVEPAVPLGANGTAPPRPVADHLQMAEPADNWELDERPRSSWPKVVAIVSWIVLLMVVCWFYVFPWLEQVLPENF